MALLLFSLESISDLILVLMFFVLREFVQSKLGMKKLRCFSFWAINSSLVMMIVLGLMPNGCYKLKLSSKLFLFIASFIFFSASSIKYIVFYISHHFNYYIIDIYISIIVNKQILTMCNIISTFNQ